MVLSLSELVYITNLAPSLAIVVPSCNMRILEQTILQEPLPSVNI